MFGRPAPIDGADRLEHTLVDRRIPHQDVHRVAPDPSQRLVRDGTAPDERVDDILVSSVAPLDDDVASVSQEGAIFEDSHDQIVDLLVAVSLADGNESVCVEGCNDRRNRWPLDGHRSSVALRADCCHDGSANDEPDNPHETSHGCFAIFPTS
jgi:hypothetical protein